MIDFLISERMVSNYKHVTKACLCCLSLLLLWGCKEQSNPITEIDGNRPNILWIISEDHGPMIGAFGDSHATTPVIDAFASKSIIYTNAFSVAPVCAPARSTLITGMYPNSIGTHNMRSFGKISSKITFFTKYLREAGYYTANIGKHDFNMIAPDGAWDETNTNNRVQNWDRTAYFRETNGEQPFFSIINLFNSHESRVKRDMKNQTRDLTNTKHNPDALTIPTYYPDALQIRQVMAQYYDNVGDIDSALSGILETLVSDGLAKDTIIFFFSDHGTGVPRSKRSPYNSGLHIPLIIHVPQKFEHLANLKAGTKTDDIVSFIDFAPTVLALTNEKIPSHLQGTPFLLTGKNSETQHAFGFRDRMDERFDVVRTARSRRFHYIKNFMPHHPHGQYIDSMYRSHEVARVWKSATQNGSPPAIQSSFFSERPNEELYDILVDPFETNNLADDREYEDILVGMRVATVEWMQEIKDIGLIAESELQKKSAHSSVYDMGQNASTYNFEQTLKIAELASQKNVSNISELIASTKHNSDTVRFWGTLGILALKQDGRDALPSLSLLLKDTSVAVRVIAAEAMCHLNKCSDSLKVLENVLLNESGAAQLRAAVALDNLDEKVAPILPAIEKLTEDYQAIKFHTGRLQAEENINNPDILRLMYISYIKRVLKKLLSDLENVHDFSDAVDGVSARNLI